MLAMAGQPTSRAIRRERGSLRGPYDSADLRVHGKLLNWARCYYGGLPGYGETGPMPTPDELDGEVIEAALVVMRRRRELYWHIVQCRYAWRWADETACRHCRRSLTSYKDDARRMLAWLGGYLERENALDESRLKSVQNP